MLRSKVLLQIMLLTAPALTYFQTSLLSDRKKALWLKNDDCIDLIEGTELVDLPIPNH